MTIGITPAKAEVGRLIDKLGFAAIDLGDPATGGKAAAVPRRSAAGDQPDQSVNTRQ